jgi:hypothetical protein
MTDGWEVAFSLDPTVDDADGDADLDGHSNYLEFLAGTDPTDAGSVPSESGGASGLSCGQEARSRAGLAILPAALVCLGILFRGTSSRAV